MKRKWKFLALNTLALAAPLIWLSASCNETGDNAKKPIKEPNPQPIPPVDESPKPIDEDKNVLTAEYLIQNYGEKINDFERWANELKTDATTSFYYMMMFEAKTNELKNELNSEKESLNNISDIAVIKEKNQEAETKIQKLYSEWDDFFARQFPPTYSFETELNKAQVIAHIKDVLDIGKRAFIDNPELKMYSKNVVYDRKAKLIKESTYYEAMMDFLQNDYKNYFELSLVANGEVMFNTKEIDGIKYVTNFKFNMINFVAENLETTINNYVNRATSLINDEMSVIEKAYILGKFVMQELVYKSATNSNETSLKTAYEKWLGVCKEYVEQFAMLLSKARLRYKILTGEQHTWLSIQNDDGKWFFVDPTHSDDGQPEKYHPVGESSILSLDYEMRLYIRKQHFIETTGRLFNLEPNDDSLTNWLSDSEYKNNFVYYINSLKEKFDKMSSLSFNDQKVYFIGKKGETVKSYYYNVNDYTNIQEHNELNNLLEQNHIKLLPSGIYINNSWIVLAIQNNKTTILKIKGNNIQDLLSGQNVTVNENSVFYINYDAKNSQYQLYVDPTETSHPYFIIEL
ncbi:hypothetical protein [Mycoplasmopsis iners]|uniref:hypothetical protein n=1 Tax=Mycoplasmopsis iners TaxID=76630 RepID=UPI00049753E8|nr:hypothetical protein [Mycoplasmopsis iners]